MFAATWELRDFSCRHFGVAWQVPNEVSPPIIHIIGSGLHRIYKQRVGCFLEIVSFQKRGFLSCFN